MMYIVHVKSEKGLLNVKDLSWSLTPNYGYVKCLIKDPKTEWDLGCKTQVLWHIHLHGSSPQSKISWLS